MKKLSEQFREIYTCEQEILDPFSDKKEPFRFIQDEYIDDLLQIKYHETMKHYGQTSLDKWIENRHSKFLKELAEKHGLTYEPTNPTR